MEHVLDLTEEEHEVFPCKPKPVALDLATAGALPGNQARTSESPLQGGSKKLRATLDLKQ